MNAKYDSMGNVKSFTNSNGGVTEYTYDKAGRLTSLTDQLGTIRYAYDKNGNVLTVTESQGTITREYDALNRGLLIPIRKEILSSMIMMSLEP